MGALDVEILANSFLEVLGFADVDFLLVFILEKVDPRRRGQGVELRFKGIGEGPGGGGCWLLAIGYWLLEIGCWLFAVGLGS